MSPTVLEPAVRHIEQFCEDRITPEMRSQLRLEHAVRGNAISRRLRGRHVSRAVGAGRVEPLERF